MTGRAPDSALGCGWMEPIHPDDHADVEREWKAAIELGTELKNQTRFVTPDGTIVWIECNRVCCAGRRHANRIVGVLEDITGAGGRNELLEAKQAAEAANEAKSSSWRMSATKSAHR